LCDVRLVGYTAVVSAMTVESSWYNGQEMKAYKIKWVELLETSHIEDRAADGAGGHKSRASGRHGDKILLRLHQIFVSPQYGICFRSTFWRL